MALVQVTPLPVRVRSDLITGRPRQVRLGDRDLPVVAVQRVREERSAYPRASGPRTTFEVVTATSRLVLRFEHRGRRWLIEGLDPDWETPSLAA
ncbi:MAG TPA: hypothetical protein VK592_02405 [Candidatus Dormibacteraeota bacterium]|nr:hypothetical protein [Candidatus Dormibacteraeota bacterium]